MDSEPDELGDLVARRRAEIGVPDRPTLQDRVREVLERFPEAPGDEPEGEADERDKARRVAAWRVLAAKMGRRYAECRLRNFNVTSDKQREALTRVQDYCRDPRARLDRGIGLLLFGPVGTGKDHLMAAAAREFVGAGASVLWRHGEDLSSGCRDLIDSEKGSESAWDAELCRPDVLALSDPIHCSGQPLSSHQLNALFRVLDRRYRDMRPVWLTINVQDRDQAKTLLSAPIVDRLIGSTVAIPCKWESARLAPEF